MYMTILRPNLKSRNDFIPAGKFSDRPIIINDNDIKHHHHG